MSRDKQIEEIAKIICAPTANKGNCDKCGFKRHCSKFDDATDLYNAGYRKVVEQSETARECKEGVDNGFSSSVTESATRADLAEEIFAEIEHTARAALILLKFERDEDIRTIKTECYEDLLGFIAELKKKYTEEEK